LINARAGRRPAKCLVDSDGDDLAGITESDLHALADNLGAAAAGHRALLPVRALVRSEHDQACERPGGGRWVELKVGGMVRVKTPSRTTWARVASRRRVIRRPANRRPTEWYLPAMDTVPGR
jgi:hypothetical protein